MAEDNLSPASFNENSLCGNPINRRNLIGVCYLWASSNFISYLLMFYSKYFEGDFFINFSVVGLSDGLSIIYV